MERSAVLYSLLFGKAKKFSVGAISSHAWLAIFICILRFCEDVTVKNDSNNIFNKYNKSEVFWEKNKSDAS